MIVLGSIGSTFSDAMRFIFEGEESSLGTVEVGGLGEISHLAGNHFLVCAVAMAVALLVSVPIALWLGHLGRAEFLAVGIANVGRAVPPLAIIAFFVAFLGAGFRNVAFALTLLAIPPILTNTYVGVRQVERELVDAARGQGMTEMQIVRQIEMPLALPTIMSGIRISAVTVLATAIIAPEAGYDTLGTPIVAYNVYGTSGQVGAAIVVALLTLAADGGLAAVQRIVTPKGLKIAGAKRTRRQPFLQIRRVDTP
ncbi:MAG: ABC transporter permease [Actinomycetota bacterium]|nr:ABC transporter permease [Actinomycetota bacterium]